MTAVSEPGKARQRGNIRRMRDRVQVRVSASEDPSTGERIILVDDEHDHTAADTDDDGFGFDPTVEDVPEPYQPAGWG